MNEKNTQPETLGGQARAFEALADMARTFPDLPSAYTTVYQQGARVSCMVDTGADFEAWRTALGIPSADVNLTVGSATAWISARGQWAGVELDLSSHDVVVPKEPKPKDVSAAALPEAWRAEVSA